MAGVNGRKRLRSPSLSDASDVSSLSETEHKGLSVSTLLTESQVFKSAEILLNPDDYPIFFLEDVTITQEDGKIADLLEATPTKKFQVIGRLWIDEEDASERKDLKYLKKKSLNGSYIKFTTQGYSQGSKPVVIWALGEGRWFEIQPSHQYRSMYSSMTAAVELYWALMHKEEDLPNETVLPGFPDTPTGISRAILPSLLYYGDLEGQGLTILSIRERILSHAPFLLREMLKSTKSGLDWKTTAIYQWLVEESPDVFKQVVQRLGLSQARSKPVKSKRSRQSSRQSSTRPSRLGHQEEVVEADTPAQETLQQSIEPGPVQTKLANSSVGTTFRQKLSELIARAKRPAEVIMAILDLLAENKGGKTDSISLATVWNAIYSNCHCDPVQFSRVYVRYHAPHVLALIEGTKWADSKFASEAKKEVALRDPNSTESREREALMKHDAKLREAVAEQQEAWDRFASQAPHVKLVVRESISQRHSPTNSMAPTAEGAKKRAKKSKTPTTPATTSTQGATSTVAHTAGKIPVLRPTGTPATASQPAAVPFPIISRPSSKVIERADRLGRKRKIELGSYSEDEDSPATQFQGETEEEARAESALSPQLINYPVPSYSHNGPNGSWVCAQEGCGYRIADLNTDEGREEMKVHLRGHQDPEAAKYLDIVRAEEARGARGTKHLTALLTQKMLAISPGRAEREAAAVASSGPVQQAPIKRANI